MTKQQQKMVDNLWAMMASAERAEDQIAEWNAERRAEAAEIDEYFKNKPHSRTDFANCDDKDLPF